MKALYSQWGQPEFSNIKDEIFHNLDYEINKKIMIAKEMMNNKTYHYTELNNLDKVITNINTIFKNIYFDYHTNLYHKSTQEILRTLSIIKNKNSFTQNKIPKNGILKVTH